MSKTYEILLKTIEDIEKTSIKEEKELKTAEDVKRILLDIQNDEIEKKAEVKAERIMNNQVLENTPYSFDMENLKRHRDDCNQRFIIPYFRGILPSWKRFNKPVIFVKKVIRKMIRSLIEPMVELQNNFNASATNAVNALYNNELVTQAFMDRQLLFNDQVLLLMQEQELTKRNTENLFAEISKLSNKIDTISSSISELKTNFNNQFEISEEEIKLVNGKIANIEMQLLEFANREDVLDLLEKQKGKTSNLANEIEHVREKIHVVDEEIEKNFARLDNGLHELFARTTEFIPCDPMRGYTDIDYFDFETNFRGSQYSIKEKLKDYIKYFPKTGTVIDLGCGRGEFLELLAENELEGIGVDTYDEFVEYCVNKGLNVVKEDAVDYVSSLSNQSVAGIFAAQLVEHLPVSKLVELCNEAYKKLMPGGTVVFETPNPTNLSIYINGFYLDPTHQNPVHPRTLEYLLKKAGFKEVDIVYTEQSKIGYRLPLLKASGAENLNEFNNGINLLSDVFFGSQDYAVIARK